MPNWLTREHKTNWERLEEADPASSAKYRDVYADQDLERAEDDAPQTAFTRTLGSVAAAIGVALVLWLFISFCEMVADSVSGYGAAGVASILSLSGLSGGKPFSAYLAPTLGKVVITVIVTAAFFTIVYALLMRNLEVQNAHKRHSDVNTYKNDRHVQLVEEVQRRFDVFPDAGAHSAVSPTTMISHMALANKGLNKVDTVMWHDSGERSNDDTEFYAALAEDTDELDIKKQPWIDIEFSDALFEASGLPERFRKRYDATKIPYNPGGKDREKLKYETWADLINEDWELPLFERQRPSGVYVVDTAPVNTLVMAITRAGKGQTIIEPTIDMWLREKNPNNIVINDPKAELLCKFYVPATVRGFQPVQLNLINALKTDICNPLALAVQAAREGDSTRCAQYIENIAEVFFPLDGGEDPVWPNAANNAFKRAAYGLIDYYMEEERELRNTAERENWDAGKLETQIDTLWGHVTLYNCYQLFVQLTAKKVKNPTVKGGELDKLNAKAKAEGFVDKEGKFIATDENQPKIEEYKRQRARIKDPMYVGLWDDQDSIDQLSLYFSATERLPRNSIRTLVNNANNALKSMGAAEKMLASVYGIAVTAMSYFADPTISTLTSGTPSQNVDLAGFSFPRRIAVRFHPNFCKRYHLIGLQARWQGYADNRFTESLGKDFYHEDLVQREGWAKCYFKGIAEGNTIYWKLELVNAQTGVLVRSFYFEFEKAYQQSLDGYYYITDPVLDEKIVKDGVIREMVRRDDGTFGFTSTTFAHKRLEYKDGNLVVENATPRTIVQQLVRYCEKPKVLFMVTPPHLMKYAKLLLIILKSLVDLNFDQSYMTKSNQKPLYKTRFMLDELGNLQSEGKGIGGFETMLSIGLGQSQEFTLILQTIAQLTALYGESVDSIVRGNAQPLNAKILTPTGWKLMGDMEVGDDVLTPKGVKTQVTGVFPRGQRKVYRVTLKDGRTCECCNEHLWKVRSL